MGALWQIIRREFNEMWRDSRARTVIFVAPVIYAGLFCMVYINHTATRLPIAVIQEENSAAARTLVRMLQASDKLEVVERALSHEELKDIIYSNKVVGGIIIPRDFSLRLKRGQDTVVSAFVNASSMVTANTAAKALNEVVQTFSAGVELRTLMKKGDRLSSAVQHFMPVKLNLHPLFNPSFNYSNFMVPGLLMTILQQVILLGIALSWTREKEFGTIKDLFSISRSPLTLLAGKALPYLLINFLFAEFYLRVLMPLNDIPMEGDWFVVIPFTLLFVITIVTWGNWMSLLFKTRLFATQALMFIAMPSFVMSGFTWPAEAMPSLIRALGQALPITYFVNSFRAVYLAGAPFRYIWQDFLILGAFALANCLIGYLLVKRQLRLNT